MFLLDNQVDKSANHKQETPKPANEEDDQRSYVFVLSSVENKEKPENADRWENERSCLNKILPLWMKHTLCVAMILR